MYTNNQDNKNNYQALVVLSGGQDSTTCLYWAMQKFGKTSVKALSFDYGQRHRIELTCAKNTCLKEQIPHVILPINTFSQLTENALTGEQAVSEKLNEETGLPNTFVPGRNLIFLSFAAALAYQEKIVHLVTGVAQTDYSGYPDCREDTLKSLQQTLTLGMEYPIQLHTPLMFLNKQQIVELAVELGALSALANTHTCYNGCRPPCGTCVACLLRAKGFEQAGIADPLLTIDF